MTFEYVDAPMGLDQQQIVYPDYRQESEQQTMGGMPSMGLMQLFGQGGGAAGSGTAAGGPAVGGTAAGAGGAGSGMGSAISAAGPWAALAAVIFANEMSAKDKYRRKDDKKHAKDLLSGEVLHQDIEKRWLPKLGISEGSKTSKIISHFANPGTGDLGRTWGRFKDMF